MIFGSVCSGIEAASVAWEPLGWKACWFAEVDRAASELLAYRFPDVPNHGDMTKLAVMVRRREIPAPDVLAGGTPCQSFSVAGMRGGLADPRGQLTIAFIDLADAIDEVRAEDGLPPVIIVWENVPGVLNHVDNPFGCFLAGLAGDDEPLELGPRPEPGKSSVYWAWSKKEKRHSPKWTNAGCAAGPSRAIAWIVKDAQYFGLAQRRRRVFVVAGAGEGFDPAAILLEFDGVRRDSAPSREAGEGATHPTAPCLTSSGRGVERTGDTRGQDPDVGVLLGRSAGIAFGGNKQSGAIDVATARNAHAVPHGRLDFESETFIVTGETPVPPLWDGRDVSQTLDAVLHKGQTMPEKNRFPAVLQPVTGFNGRMDPCVYGDLVGTLDRDALTQCVAFSSKDFGGDATQDMSPTLRASGHGETHANGGSPPAVAYAFQPRIARNGRGDMGEVVNALTAQAGETGKGDAAPCVAYSIARDALDRSGEASDGSAASRSGLGLDVDIAATIKGKGPGAVAYPPAVCVTEPVTHTLRADGFDASEDGTGRGQPIVCGFQASQSGTRLNDTAGTLDANYGSRRHNGALVQMAVRRLMPVECERLQGFPDNWTLIPTGPKRKPAADGPRYKQCGNSMAVNVMHWIGRRIAAAQSSMVGHNGGPSMFEDILGGESVGEFKGLLG